MAWYNISTQKSDGHWSMRVSLGYYRPGENFFMLSKVEDKILDKIRTFINSGKSNLSVLPKPVSRRWAKQNIEITKVEYDPPMEILKEDSEIKGLWYEYILEVRNEE